MHFSIVEPGRARRRSKSAQAGLDRAIEAVVANLAYLVIRPTDTGRLVVPMDTGHKRIRYQHPLLAVSTLKRVIKALDGSVLLLNTGRIGGGASTIQPTDWFER